MTTTATCPKTIPFGRLAELRARLDSELIAVKVGSNVFSDCIVKRYHSRKALEVFLKNAGGWHALVKNEVPRNMLLYPAFQTAAK